VCIVLKKTGKHFPFKNKHELFEKYFFPLAILTEINIMNNQRTDNFLLILKTNKINKEPSIFFNVRISKAIKLPCKVQQKKMIYTLAYFFFIRKKNFSTE